MHMHSHEPMVLSTAGIRRLELDRGREGVERGKGSGEREGMSE